MYHWDSCLEDDRLECCLLIQCISACVLSAEQGYIGCLNQNRTEQNSLF